MHPQRSIDIDHDFFELAWILFGKLVPDRVEHYAVLALWQYSILNLQSLHEIRSKTASDKLAAFFHQNDIEFRRLESFFKVRISVTAKAISLLEHGDTKSTFGAVNFCMQVNPVESLVLSKVTSMVEVMKQLGVLILSWVVYDAHACHIVFLLIVAQWNEKVAFVGY